MIYGHGAGRLCNVNRWINIERRAVMCDVYRCAGIQRLTAAKMRMRMKMSCDVTAEVRRASAA